MRRVLYMSGDTEKTIDPDGVLEPGLAFIQKRFSDELTRKIRDVLAADRPPLF
jgi:hypothetical protein